MGVTGREMGGGVSKMSGGFSKIGVTGRKSV
jgi:hypothetical protein